MRRQLKIGLVVPFATDRVPDEGPMMYPEAKPWSTGCEAWARGASPSLPLTPIW